MGELEVSRAHQPDGGAYRRVRWPINTGCPAIGNRNSRLVRGTGRHTRTRGLVPPWSTIGGIDKSNATARTLGGNSTGNGTGCHRPQKVWPIYSIIVPIAFQRVAAHPFVKGGRPDERLSLDGLHEPHTLYLLENKGGSVAG